jgi:hypothetical protein
MTTRTRETPDTSAEAPRRQWIRPDVRRVGTVGEILKGGTGKTSVNKDPMEPVGFEGPES